MDLIVVFGLMTPYHGPKNAVQLNTPKKSHSFPLWIVILAPTQEAGVI